MKKYIKVLWDGKSKYCAVAMIIICFATGQLWPAILIPILLVKKTYDYHHMQKRRADKLLNDEFSLLLETQKLVNTTHNEQINLEPRSNMNGNIMEGGIKAFGKAYVKHMAEEMVRDQINRTVNNMTNKVMELSHAEGILVTTLEQTNNKLMVADANAKRAVQETRNAVTEIKQLTTEIKELTTVVNSTKDAMKKKFDGMQEARDRDFNTLMAAIQRSNQSQRANFDSIDLL